MTLKQCPVPECGKSYEKLTAHMINVHPGQMQKYLEAFEGERSPEPPSQAPTTPMVPKNSSQIIAQAMQDMVNIKIIQMLGNGKESSLQELQTAINPPQRSTMQEVKEMHDMVYGKNLPYIETSNEWANVVQQALPIVKDFATDMVDKKIEMEAKKNGNKNGRHSAGQETGGSVRQISRKQIEQYGEQSRAAAKEPTADSDSNRRCDTTTK